MNTTQKFEIGNIIKHTHAPSYELKDFNVIEATWILMVGVNCWFLFDLCFVTRLYENLALIDGHLISTDFT